MLKFLGMLTLLGLVFASGYYVGRQGPDAVFTKARQIGAEVMAKTSSLERDVTLRMSLVNAKDRLIQAKSDLLDKNYGKAAAELGEAAQHLTTAKEAAGEDIQKKLEGLVGKVSEVTADTRSLKGGAQGKLEDAVKSLDTLLKR
jgi:type I site-specific restriction endonuclease